MSVISVEAKVTNLPSLATSPESSDPDIIFIKSLLGATDTAGNGTDSISQQFVTLLHNDGATITDLRTFDDNSLTGLIDSYLDKSIKLGGTNKWMVRGKLLQINSAPHPSEMEPEATVERLATPSFNKNPNGGIPADLKIDDEQVIEHPGAGSRTGINTSSRTHSRNPSAAPRFQNQPSLNRRFSSLGYTDPQLLKAIAELPADEQLKTLKEQNTKLSHLLTMTENLYYNPTSNDNLTPDDIETLRALFESIDTDEDGCISGIEPIVELYTMLGEPITEKEAKNLLKNKKLIPDGSGQVTFQNFLPFWQMTHRGGKKNKYYTEQFKFLTAKLRGDFDINNIVTTKAGKKATTEFRVNFWYKVKGGASQRISPWHDIPLHTFSAKKDAHIYNFVCEIPKWTRAKYEIATGEPYNPIHQDVKNGKLRYYKHGDMMFNYGALPQTWEDPGITPKETGAPGDNDPIDCIEIGTKQLPTGSVTPVKILGVLALLDSGETDWKLLGINISDELATRLNDVHDIDEIMPGAIKAIREFFRIYKVCTGKAENSYAFQGEALPSEFAIRVIEETHEQWKHKIDDSLGDDNQPDPFGVRYSSKGTILTV